MCESCEKCKERGYYRDCKPKKVNEFGKIVTDYEWFVVACDCRYGVQWAEKEPSKQASYEERRLDFVNRYKNRGYSELSLIKMYDNGARSVWNTCDVRELVNKEDSNE